MSEIKVEKPSKDKIKQLQIPDSPQNTGVWSVWECEPSSFDWEYSDKGDHLSHKPENPVNCCTDIARGSQKSSLDFSPRVNPSQTFVKEVPEVIGQFRDSYILCQTSDGLLIIDQHAAHERIVYEKLKKSFESSTIEVQPFLIPHQLELSTMDSRVVLKNLDQLALLGFELDHF